MANRLVFDGMDELRAALRNLPADLTAEAGGIVDGAGDGAVAEMKSNYPARTGHLRDHVYVTHQGRGRFGAGSVVKNTSPHAAIFENGTQARHTSIGANRGSMPPGHVFVPAMVRARRRMWTEIRAMLVRKGLLVTGDAG